MMEAIILWKREDTSTHVKVPLELPIRPIQGIDIEKCVFAQSTMDAVMIKAIASVVFVFSLKGHYYLYTHALSIPRVHLPCHTNLINIIISL